MRDLAREPHLVGDHHHRHALAREFDHYVEHLVDHLRVERGGRLVEQHRDRIHGECARDRHALLLPARELTRVLRGVLGQPDALEQLGALGVRLVTRTIEYLHLRQREILGHRHVWKQLEVLEHHAHL